MLDQTQKTCFLCGSSSNLECHHIFGGSYRPKSERYGLKVWLCHSCHDEVHFGLKSKELMAKLRTFGQLRFERDYPDKDFIKEFGRNYIKEREKDSVDIQDVETLAKTL